MPPQTPSQSITALPPKAPLQSASQSFDVSLSQVPQLSSKAVPPQTPAQSWDALPPSHTPQSSITAEPPHVPAQSSTLPLQSQSPSGIEVLHPH